MPIPKKYFHDRMVLLLLSVSAFLTILTTVLVLLRLGGNHSGGYIVQYRANLGISAYAAGKITELLAFIVFSVLILGLHTILSIRIYAVNRQFALAVLGLGLLLLVLSLIVSNALLVLR